MRNLGLYVHVPFCKSKCPYCDFYSIAASEDVKEKYAEAIIKSLSLYNNLSADTIYFGGGTPFLLGSKRLCKILLEIKKRFNIAPNAEVTVEANPQSVDESELSMLYQNGFNRISFGVQSANRRELDILKRTHTLNEIELAVLSARRAGFNNISADIMLGTPNQSIPDIKNTLRFVMSLGVEHISAYMLKIEPNTPFNCNEVVSLLPDEDTISDIYLTVCDTLAQNGYIQYEISNFAKRGFESRHNLKYWKCEEYLGFGPAAHSYFNGKRFYYKRDIKDFIESGGKNIIFDSNADKLCEYIMLGLRLSEGISLNEINALGGNENDILQRCRVYLDNGFMIKNSEQIALTPKGFLVSNTIIASLI